MRLGVLIHAESVAPTSWSPLHGLLGERGTIAVAHAHADWTSPEMGPWLPVLRRHRIDLRHHFRARTSQDPALVALTLDAVELASTGRLDGMVLVGAVGSTMPLLRQLGELGLSVIVAGPPATPLDIRGACAEFVDLHSLEDGTGPHPGRHRA